MSVVIYFFEKPCLLRRIDESTHDNCFILQKNQMMTFPRIIKKTIKAFRCFYYLTVKLIGGLDHSVHRNLSSVGYMAGLGLHPVPTTGSAKYTERLRKVYLGGVHTESPVFLPSGCKK